MLVSFRGVIRLNGFGLDDDTRVAFLIVLTLRRNRPRHVTTREHRTGCHDNHNSFHNFVFSNTLQKYYKKTNPPKKRVREPRKTLDF